MPLLIEQLLIDRLKTAYGLDVVTLTLFLSGADRRASVYKAQTLDQGVYFIKLRNGHHHNASIRVTELLHDAGIKVVISPVKTILGKSTEPMAGCTLIVYPFINGQTGLTKI